MQELVKDTKMGPSTLLAPTADKRSDRGSKVGSPGHPLVSVIIPTKNSERTIRPCLESVCAQTYTNFEFVEVDNFSRDSTVRKANEYDDLVLMAGQDKT